MRAKRYCLFCGQELTKTSQKIYCSSLCCAQHKRQKLFEEIEAKGEFPQSGRLNETDRRTARLWLEAKYGHQCAICGHTEWLENPIPLIVDHIDGNSSNHKIDNFRLICPNCDAQLQTYKSRNQVRAEYQPGDRHDRKSAEYDRMLARHGFVRSTKRTRAKAICPICNKEFAKKHKTQKYCSKACVAIALRKVHI